MDQDAFNMSIRKFLKMVGVSSQREIGFVLAVVLAHRRRGGDALAEQRLQLGDHRLVEFTRLVHGATLA